MKNRKTTATAGIIFGAIILSILLIGFKPNAWKPGSNDIRIINTTGYPYTVTVQLFGYFEDETPPWSWLWLHEFWLENRYIDALDIHLDLQVSDLNGGFSTLTAIDVTVPSKDKKKVVIRGGFNTASKDILLQRAYRIMARTQIEHAQGNEIKTHIFEWELATGLINQTTKTIIPDKVPNEP